jgi:hypothetical protein
VPFLKAPTIKKRGLREVKALLFFPASRRLMILWPHPPAPGSNHLFRGREQNTIGILAPFLLAEFKQPRKLSIVKKKTK